MYISTEPQHQGRKSVTMGNELTEFTGGHDYY